MPDLEQKFSDSSQFPNQSYPYPLSFSSQNLTQIKLLEKITSLVPGLIAIYNIHTGNYIYVNNSLTKILGYSKSNFLKGGLSFVASLVHPSDVKMLLEKNNLALRKANSLSSKKNDLSPLITFEYRMKHKNGSWRWLHTTGVVFDRNSLGDVEHVMNISIDITKRKEEEIREIAKRRKIEEDLKQGEDRFRVLLEHSADAITLLDRTGKRVYATPSRKNILGYDSKQDFGKSVFDYVHPLDKAQVLPAFQKLLLEPSNPTTMVFRVLHQKGYWIWIEATGTNLLHIPQIAAIVINYRDVSERQENEEKTRFLEKASNILFSSIDLEVTLKNIANLVVPELADYCRIALKDEDGQIKEVSLNHIDPKKISLVKKLYQQYKNKPNLQYGIEKILQTGEPEIIPKITPKILQPVQDDPKILKTLYQLQIKSYLGVPLKARGKIIGAMTFSSAKENVFYSEKNLDFAKELAYRMALALDNTRLYTNEQNAVRLRDHFISVASHELKTPITSIKGFIQILQTHAPGSLISYYLQRLDDQVIRLTELINDLLDVSRIQQGKLDLRKESCFLNQFLQEIISDIQPTAGNHLITLQSAKNIKVWIDKYRLSQVIINLLTNAIKYSPQAHKVLISATQTNDSVRIMVEDFGIGIFAKNLTKIFDPFYQADTKVRQSFGGLGLGLHISQEIVKRHGGEILVASNKGQGSTFTIILPKQIK